MVAMPKQMARTLAGFWLCEGFYTLLLQCYNARDVFPLIDAA